MKTLYKMLSLVWRLMLVIPATKEAMIWQNDNSRPARKAEIQEDLQFKASLYKKLGQHGGVCLWSQLPREA
jgi:hypothetical protein